MANIVESGALAVVDLLLLQPSVDVVGVLDQSFTQLFPAARPMRLAVRENSRTMEHPLETGQIISDYKIILPIEIDILFMVPAADYRNTYQQIKGQFITSQKLTVQTKSASYGNMIIAEMPHEEKPEIFDSLLINLHFKQIQIVQPSPDFAPADPTQANTQALGEQSMYLIPDPVIPVERQQLTAELR